MHQGLDTAHLRRGSDPGRTVGDVTDDHLPREGPAGRLGVCVHLPVEQVEGRDLEPHRSEPSGQVLPDEARPSGEEDGHGSPLPTVSRSRG